MAATQVKAMERQLQDLDRKMDALRRHIERLQGQLAEFRFESHQEHQQFYRMPQENVVEWLTTLPCELVSRP